MRRSSGTEAELLLLRGLRGARIRRVVLLHLLSFGFLSLGFHLLLVGLLLGLLGLLLGLVGFLLGLLSLLLGLLLVLLLHGVRLLLHGAARGRLCVARRDHRDREH